AGVVPRVRGDPVWAAVMAPTVFCVGFHALTSQGLPGHSAPLIPLGWVAVAALGHRVGARLSLVRIRTRVRPWLIRGALVAFGVGVPLLVVELGLRLSGRYAGVSDASLIDHNERIFTRRAGDHRTWTHPDRPVDFDIRYNNLGLRHDRDIGAAELDRAATVGFFGDSTTENQNMPAAYTYPEVVDYLLNAGGAPAAVTLNFGVSGYGTDQAYLTWREHSEGHRALDVVVYLLCANDLRNIYENGLFGLDDGRLVSRAPSRGAWWLRAVGKLRLTYLVLDARARWREQSGGDAQVVERLLRGQLRDARDGRRQSEEARAFDVSRLAPAELSSSEEAIAEAAAVFVALLQRWQREAEARGSRFMVAVYPRGRERRLAGLIPTGIPVVDLWEPFEAEFGPDYDHDRYAGFVNDGHWNEQANQLAGIALYRVIARALARAELDDTGIRAALGAYYAAVATYWTPRRWVSPRPTDAQRDARIRARYAPAQSEGR
ncbi:MAG: lysophospholipase L1-like esterase, partial [Myxococcota bacterium]